MPDKTAIFSIGGCHTPHTPPEVMPLSMAVYLDVLSVLTRLFLSEQKEQHDPVKAVCQIQEFRWSMVKLHGHVRDALDNNELNQAEKSRLTHYNKFRSEVTFKMDENAYIYRGRKLKNFKASECTVSTIYQSTIASLSIRNVFLIPLIISAQMEQLNRGLMPKFDD